MSTPFIDIDDAVFDAILKRLEPSEQKKVYFQLAKIEQDEALPTGAEPLDATFKWEKLVVVCIDDLRLYFVEGHSSVRLCHLVRSRNARRADQEAIHRLSGGES